MGFEPTLLPAAFHQSESQRHGMISLFDDRPLFLMLFAFRVTQELLDSDESYELLSHPSCFPCCTISINVCDNVSLPRTFSRF